MSEYNHKRLESRIREAISMLILTNEVKNPHISRFISITDVHLSKDKAYATVWVSSLDHEAQLDSSVEALQSAAGFIQQRLASVMKTRNTPRLTFKIDTSVRDGQRINELLEKIKKE
ncbi:MAG: 30S ribosome-binding factor RbfA [Sphaerochaetaceae bacterium]|jgi:ribosome-binding factor A|nr:30S ribosome-binding factor RbfA [Sphaerochaetaceae bacterium]NLO60484.1 30S ribosome-binding factor RbfA [Spirochaetales bacterium]MDD2407166.1 30S ribosome-binding factor RbfA [Sphaerochaetaceae bacterium]MDD3670183.1 30S ribosome-binding factor RbfA [Sphaerochaetaceae bacterium]MDD4260189.1 30S ribosome-binding factor RbfA [Sphaerochaetaceae bacterium]